MQNFDVNKLRVASPCSMNWENMSGDERVRFCQSCQLNVYNLSELTANEIKQLISQKEGRICGRLHKRADGTVITKDCPIGLRAMRKRISRRASAVFAAVLSLFSIGLSQKSVEEDSNLLITRTATQNEHSSIRGKVSDSAGVSIPNAKISFINRKTKKKLKLETDENGDFRFEKLLVGLYDLKVSYDGFSTKEIKGLEVTENEKLNLEVILEVRGKTVTVGLFAENNGIDTTSSSTTYIVTKKMIEDLPH